MKQKFLDLQFWLSQRLSYNYENKEKFKKAGQDALKAFAKEMGFSEFKVDFNAGGIAVSGDHSLRGMFPDGTGVALYISKGAFSSKAGYCRSIAHMKDYTGGKNIWIDVNDLSAKKLKETLLYAAKQSCPTFIHRP